MATSTKFEYEKKYVEKISFQKYNAKTMKNP